MGAHSASNEQREVRFLCQELLNLPESPIKVPSAKQVQQFERLKKQQFGPDLGDLHLDLASGGLASAWNKRAAVLFAEYVLETKQSKCRDSRKIQKAFRRHLLTLQKQYKDSLQNDESSDEELQQGRRDKEKQKARESRRRSVRHVLSNLWTALH
jgi:hypothetical protein